MLYKHTEQQTMFLQNLLILGNIHCSVKRFSKLQIKQCYWIFFHPLMLPNGIFYLILQKKRNKNYIPEI